MKIHELKIKFRGFCLIILLMVGCSSSDSISEPSYLDGYVAGKTDISAAGLQVTYPDGSLIAEKKAPATSDYGVFMISVPYLPYQFRVVSSGGVESGENVNYTLMGQFEAFNPDSDMIYLNFVTTLVCVYLDRNPGKSLSDATDAVKAFLDIPGVVDIGRGLYHQDKYFSPERFVEEAATEGGVFAFMETLVDELIQGTVEKHTFPPPPVLYVTPVQCAGISMTTAARNGAIAWGAAFALDKSLEAVFPGTGAPSTADIDALHDMLIDIQKQITQLKNEVMSALAEMKALILRDEFDTIKALITDYVTVIENTFNSLKMDLQADVWNLPESTEEQKAFKKKKIAPVQNDIRLQMNVISTQIVPHLGYLHKVVYGDGGDNHGLYKTYADMLKAEHRYLTKASYHDKVLNLFLYYNQIEATAVYLALEYYRSKEDELHVGPQLKRLSDESIKEQAWYDSVETIPAPLLLDRDQGLMMYSGEYCYNDNVCPTSIQMYGGIEVMTTAAWIYEFNQQERSLGYNDWELPTGAQMTPWFSGYIGEPSMIVALNDHGWSLPLGANFYFTTKDVPEQINIHRLDHVFYVFGTEAQAWYRLDFLDPDNIGPWSVVPVRTITDKHLW